MVGNSKDVVDLGLYFGQFELLPLLGFDCIRSCRARALKPRINGTEPSTSCGLDLDDHGKMFTRLKHELINGNVQFVYCINMHIYIYIL